MKTLLTRSFALRKQLITSQFTGISNGKRFAPAQPAKTSERSGRAVAATVTNVGVRLTSIAGLTVGLLCSTGGLSSAATNTSQIAYDAWLTGVGLNPTGCTPAAGAASNGYVHIATILGIPGQEIRAYLSSAKKNSKYQVDIRCVKTVTTITTDSRGNAELGIDVSGLPAVNPGVFYIDFTQPPGSFTGPAGAGGYGDTYVAGPFVQAY